MTVDLNAFLRNFGHIIPQDNTLVYQTNGPIMLIGQEEQEVVGALNNSVT